MKALDVETVVVEVVGEVVVEVGVEVGVEEVVEVAAAGREERNRRCCHGRVSRGQEEPAVTYF